MKIIDSKDAVKLIKSCDTLAVSGFAGVAVPEDLLKELGLRYIKENEPRDITLMFAAGQGDGKEKGLNHIAYEGLIKRVVGAHFNLAPKLGNLILNNKVQAYNLPQGVMCNIFRDIARKSGYTLSRVGLGTFVDPRNEGGKANDITREDYVELVNINSEEFLLFKNENIDVAFIKGTFSDKSGNISMEHEATYSEAFVIAQAVKNCGGIVIVQVDDILEEDKMPCNKVKIPRIYVDYVVKVDDNEKSQILGLKYDEGLCGTPRIKGEQSKEKNNSVNIINRNNKISAREIIGKRAFMELKKGDVVNIGIGVPEEVAKEAKKNNFNQFITLTVEPGAIGGIPQSGIKFGSSYNPECIIDQLTQFDFYDGGGLDISFLGMAECDKHGNINVSRFGNKIPGCGGFINITQNSKRTVFCGTFTAGGLDINVQDGKLEIISEGKNIKFVNNVSQVTFSGEFASQNSKDVLYITERCVFKLFEDGLHLIEIAPGVDVENDVIRLMDFIPIIDNELKVMDESCFSLS
ncbi:malonate decarboxylase subunit alpha [Clostridium sp. SM-530-WT-3G]|uniref:acyl CoA:acetate/3-ketoacid CoA transferase n=1 Tax=Clostridium sp. SM-530-WT-3G TaxID=2725303 RepID=UPI00145F8A92|nr:malonate decarboxylase subunit alpha [Clostridium sp. SM-530-WT-3G]NME83239.1 3-oxoacid CoA-transferase [Clostridium sp. SM-530-WT-3G]